MKKIFRIYKLEEIKAMNYILGKKEGNNEFTKFELECMSQINLLDKKVVNICKIIWANKDNEEKLNSFLQQLKEVSTNEK